LRKVNLTATIELLIDDDDADVSVALDEWRSVFGGSLPSGTASISDIIIVSSEVIDPGSNVFQLRLVEREK